MTTLNEHRRSVAFLDCHGDRWACFLVTFPERGGMWHGYFSFRPSHGDLDEDEVRTTDIFIEESEEEIHEKARGLGRPLLAGLLESALYTASQAGNVARLTRRFRSLLVRSSVDIAGDWSTGIDLPPGGDEVERLRSLYESYRLDQVAHFICLVDTVAFDEAVDRILDGKSIDFRTTDRMQYAMMVVDHIESLLPLPDFDTWARDFVEKPETYRVYAHTLHREGRLP